jgi:glycosyltransferase involved in cell wall biosynthesis
MSRISCKVCRRAGESLCGREKCAQKKRPFAPGILDSQRKHKGSFSEYGQQLNEKRKVRATYGLREKQFAGYVSKAMASKGTDTVSSIYKSLETRLDNVTYRIGFAVNRALARQLVSHGHIPLGNYIDQYSNTTSQQESRDRLGIPKTNFVYLFLGRIEKYKGVEQLIKAFNDIKLKGLYILIVGQIYDPVLKEKNNKYSLKREHETSF